MSPADASKRFSPSKLGTYRDCPRRYQYRYIDKIRRETRFIEAFLGECAHRALEELYEGLRHGRKAGREEVAASFERAWESEYSEEIRRQDQRYTALDWKGIGRECVTGYYDLHFPFAEDRTVEVEKRVSFPLRVGEEECSIEGFIDRLALAPDGAFEVHDYKTGRSLPAQQEVDRDWQLAIYDLAVRHAWPDTQRVRLVWHYLRHGRRLVSERSAAQREVLKGEIAALIAGIKRDREFPPHKSALCGWCEYRDICPLWRHAEELSRLPPEEAGREEGAVLVARLAALEAKKRKLREELRQLEREAEPVEEAIKRYAQARGLSVVSGREGEAAVSEKEDYRFPNRSHSPEILEALERELKESPLWREVSSLDPHRLMEGYKRKEWPPAWIETIEGALKRYEIGLVREKTVRLRRRREAED